MMQNVVYKIFIKFVFRVTKSPIKPHFRGGAAPPPLKFFQGGAFSTLGGGGLSHFCLSSTTNGIFDKCLDICLHDYFSVNHIILRKWSNNVIACCR